MNMVGKLKTSENQIMNINQHTTLHTFWGSYITAIIIISCAFRPPTITYVMHCPLERLEMRTVATSVISPHAGRHRYIGIHTVSPCAHTHPICAGEWV